MLAVVSFHGTCPRKVFTSKPPTTYAQDMHETGARHISPGLLWAIGRITEKAKPDFRAFYWRENNSEIWRKSEAKAPQLGATLHFARLKADFPPAVPHFHSYDGVSENNIF